MTYHPRPLDVPNAAVPEYWPVALCQVTFRVSYLVLVGITSADSWLHKTSKQPASPLLTSPRFPVLDHPI